MTVTANCLKSTAASELTDSRYSFTYFVNGDFVQNGLDKSLMFYEYLPSGLSWDTLNSMVANFTADGVRCEYRVFGYKSGGGGTLVFDSGGGGKYGQAIDITGAGFDYFNILLSAYDKDGNQIEVGNIDSGYIVWGYGELVQLPTTPPELVDDVDSINEGINGGEESTLPTESDGLPQYTTGAIPDVSIPEQGIACIALFTSVAASIFNAHWALSSACGVVVILALAWYVLYGRR